MLHDGACEQKSPGRLLRSGGLHGLPRLPRRVNRAGLPMSESCPLRPKTIETVRCALAASAPALRLRADKIKTRTSRHYGLVHTTSVLLVKFYRANKSGGEYRPWIFVEQL